MKKKTYKKKGYVKCELLEDIGLKPHQYGTNFCDKSDKQWGKWRKQRKKNGFDERETWCMDFMFYQWLYTRLTMYKKKAKKIVDLTFYKFQYTPSDTEIPIEVTQKTAIDIVRNEAKRMILSDDDTEVFDKNIMNLFYDLLPHLWW